MLCASSAEPRLARLPSCADPSVTTPDCCAVLMTENAMPTRLRSRSHKPSASAAERLSAAVALRPAVVLRTRAPRPQVERLTSRVGPTTAAAALARAQRHGSSSAPLPSSGPFAVLTEAERDMVRAQRGKRGAAAAVAAIAARPLSGAVSADGSLDDYARTGLRSYRPAAVKRHSFGWLQTNADVQSQPHGWTGGETGGLRQTISSGRGHSGRHLTADAKFAGTTRAHIHVCFPESGKRPVAGKGKYNPRFNRQCDTLGADREAVPVHPQPEEAPPPLEARALRVDLTHDVVRAEPPGPSQRRSISLTGITSPRSHRQMMSTPRMEASQRLVSDATVKRLVRSCKIEVAQEKQDEDDALEAQRVAEQEAHDAMVLTRAEAEEAQRLIEQQREWEEEQAAEDEKRLAEIARLDAVASAKDLVFKAEDLRLEAARVEVVEESQRIQKDTQAAREVEEDEMVAEDEVALQTATDEREARVAALEEAISQEAAAAAVQAREAEAAALQRAVQHQRRRTKTIQMSDELKAKAEVLAEKEAWRLAEADRFAAKQAEAARLAAIAAEEEAARAATRSASEERLAAEEAELDRVTKA